MRAKAEREGRPEAQATSPLADDEPPGSREARRRWAALIQRVFEVDPLECPECLPVPGLCLRPSDRQVADRRRHDAGDLLHRAAAN